MGIGVVSLGVHRHEVGDLVLTPRGSVNARAFARLFRTRVEATAIDVDDRQSRNDRGLGRRLLVLELVHPPIPILLQLLADFVGDPPHLPAADGDFRFVSERFRGVVEGSAARGGAEDLTKDRRREVVRVEPQARAQREKNPGDMPGNDRGVRRTRWSRREPEWFLTPCRGGRLGHIEDTAGNRRGFSTGFSESPRWPL